MNFKKEKFKRMYKYILTCFPPHYVSLGLIKLPDIIKLSTCQLFYGYIVDKKIF